MNVETRRFIYWMFIAIGMAMACFRSSYLMNEKGISLGNIIQIIIELSIFVYAQLQVNKTLK